MTSENFVADMVLQEIFVDKDLITFLSNGYVWFFDDNNRSIGKPVYQITGSPPNYTYIPYGFWVGVPNASPWQVNLDSDGAFDTPIYYFPYEGTPGDSTGAQDLYFIQVYSSTNVLQFSREGWPPNQSSGGNIGTTITQNLIPNPQFRINFTPPAGTQESGVKLGQIIQPVTDIGWGGWTYVIPESSSTKDFVTFTRFGSYITNPPPYGNPRYAINVQCESPGSGDTQKDITLTYEDVNKFNNGDTYTFAVTGLCTSGTSISAGLWIIRNFGAGGSAQSQTQLTTFTIPNSETTVSYNFTFPSNSGFTLGTDNTDNVQVVLRLPLGSVFSAQFTDFILSPGKIANPIFVDIPNEQFMWESGAGELPIPATDGSDFYLPLISTPTGYGYDPSTVGSILWSLAPTPPKGYLAFDGAVYQTNLTSSDGIPYYRIQNFLFNFNSGTSNFPLFGTGQTFFSNYIDASATDYMIVTTNQPGLVTAPSDGATATGFTFTKISTGQASTNINTYFGASNNFMLYTQNPVANDTNYSNGTTGFTLIQLRAAGGVANFYQSYDIETTPIPSASQYWQFRSNNGSGDIDYYQWFKVNGSGSDPAPGGTGVEVDILSTYTTGMLATVCAITATGAAAYSITTVAGSAIPAGAYFNLSTTSANYYVWYTVNGAGTDPEPAGAIGISVAILSTDTSAQVATKTQIAMNSFMFCIGLAAGFFPRIWNDKNILDPDAKTRYAFAPGYAGDNVCSIEIDAFISHFHEIAENQTALAGATVNVHAPGSGAYSQFTGGNETRGVNIAFNAFIHY